MEEMIASRTTAPSVSRKASRGRMLTPADYAARKAIIEFTFRNEADAILNPHSLWPIVESFHGQSFTSADFRARIRELKPDSPYKYPTNSINVALLRMMRSGTLKQVSPPPVKIPRHISDAPPKHQQYRDKYLNVPNSLLVKLYASGMSCKSIAQQLSALGSPIADLTVRNRLCEAGVQLRSRGRSESRGPGGYIRYRANLNPDEQLTALQREKDRAIAELERQWAKSPFSKIDMDDVAKLPQPHRHVIESRMQGHELERIGRRLHMTREAVRQIQSKAFKLLDEM